MEIHFLPEITHKRQIMVMKLETVLNSHWWKYIDRQVTDRNFGVPLTVCLAPVCYSLFLPLTAHQIALLLEKGHIGLNFF